MANYPSVKKPSAANTQNAKILEALQNGDELTTFDGFERFKCARLGSRIWDLRHGKYDGSKYNIRYEKRTNEKGDEYYAYFLDKDEPIIQEGQKGFEFKDVV